MKTNGTAKVQDVLDRMVVGSVATSQNNDGDLAPYVPSATWEGPRPGYYFGTTGARTGYYLDGGQGKPKERKRKVQINEDNNEMRLLPSTMLERAEQQASGSTVLELTPKGINSASNALTKIVNQNAMQRAQFADDPQQYMNSELALYEQLTALQAIAANAQLYQHLVENDTLLSTLTELLGHENIDVCASVVALFLEWLDPSLVGEYPDLTSIVEQLASRVLVDAWETIASNLSRFQKQADSGDENQDQTLKGVDNTLSLMENFLEIDLSLPNGLSVASDLSAAGYMAKETNIISWLLQQVQGEEGSNEFRGRCVELLAFVSQREDVHQTLPNWSQLPPFSSASIDVDVKEPKQKKKKTGPIQGIEILLQSIGAYRKRQPENNNEVEMLENACIVLSSCVAFSIPNLSAFLEGQGIQLVVRCLRERVHAGACALKLLDFFGGDPVHKQGSEKLVEAGGLKYLFPMFLGTRIPKPALSQGTTAKAKREWFSNIETQTIRILYALTRHLDDNSPEEAKARFVAKFVQDVCKCDRLVELLLSYDQKARKAEYNFYRSDVEEEVQEEETVRLAALDARLKGGGDIFHKLGAINAFVCVHSKRCHERIISKLQLQQSGVSLVRAAVEEFASLLDPGIQKQQLERYLANI